MSAIGINVSADGRHDGRSLRDLNVTWARVAARADFDLRDRFADYRRHDVRVLLVFDRLSVEQFPSPSEAFAHYRDLYVGEVRCAQIGNEADHASDSSWTMTPDELAALGRTARAELPGWYLVCAGMASGQPDYLVGADLSWCDAIAMHPYLKDAPNPNDVEDLEDIGILLDRYQALGLPVWITEWGWWGDDEARGAEEVGDMVRWAAARTDVPAFFYFCLDDAMVAPFGLYTDRGAPKPAVAPFRSQAARAVEVPLVPPPIVVPPPPPPTLPELAAVDQAWCDLWQSATVAPSPVPFNPASAFYKHWAANREAVGLPVGPERSDDGGTFQAFSRAGVLKWAGGDAVEAA